MHDDALWSSSCVSGSDYSRSGSGPKNSPTPQLTIAFTFIRHLEMEVVAAPPADGDGFMGVLPVTVFPGIQNRFLTGCPETQLGRPVSVLLPFSFQVCIQLLDKPADIIMALRLPNLLAIIAGGLDLQTQDCNIITG